MGSSEMGSFTGGAPTPFSEPREWGECRACRAREAASWRRYVRGAVPEDPFAPCPSCGQPPRCTVRQRRPDRCPRPATGCYAGPEADLCGQHARSIDLAHTIEEWETAGGHLGKFRTLAEELCNWALLEALDLAWAECEMRAEGARQEREMIWEGSE